MAKDTIIILPTFNERENIQKIIPEIFSYLPEVNILVVDDNSPEGIVDASISYLYTRSLFQRNK